MDEGAAVFKFEKLEVWRLALEYSDRIYHLASLLPRAEDYNLKSQIIRAATSIALNIAEGSTGQTNVEQGRFIGMAMRSALETVACQHLIRRREYVRDPALMADIYESARVLVAKLNAMRRILVPDQTWIRETADEYQIQIGSEESETAESRTYRAQNDEHDRVVVEGQPELRSL